jgi:hypothetical protein
MKTAAIGCGNAVAQPAAGEKRRRGLDRRRDGTFITFPARSRASKDPRIGASRPMAREVAGLHPSRSL